MFKKRLVGAMALLVSTVAVGGHHEEGEAPMAAATAGQIIVAYEVPCADPVAGAARLKALIAYEASASPVAYSSVATTIGNAKVGAVDVHSSMQAMDKAFAWQEQDDTWLAMQALSLTVCETDLDSIEMSVHIAQ